ncbi:hypothetical protein I552_1151 [Mycobacterium xenopi 3993]|nr:hypothetical protein I552_1151 [Mycobacterium xenopi 3993]
MPRRADVAETEDRAAVADDGDQPVRPGVAAASVWSAAMARLTCATRGYRRSTTHAECLAES